MSKVIVRRAFGIGAALTLSLVSFASLSDATASMMCTETDMAGIGVALDDYYVAQYGDEAATGSAVTEVTEEEEQVDESASPSAEAIEVDITDAIDKANQEDDVSLSETTESVTEEDKESKETKEEVKEADKEEADVVSPAAVKDESKEKEDKDSDKDDKTGPGRFITEKRFEDVGISIASNYVNVRKKPSENAKIKGKLYRGCSAVIKKSEKGWVKIESGDVKGYIKKEFLAIGEDAQDIAAQYMKRYVQVKDGVVTLNVRSKKGTNSTIVTQIPEGEMYEVKGSATHWVKIDLGDGDKGYVAKKFVKCKVRFKHAISLKEERARLRAKRAAERAERKRLAALAAQQAAAQQAAAQTTTTQTQTTTTQTQTQTQTTTTQSQSSTANRSNPVGSGGSSSSKSSGKPAPVASSSVGSSVASYAQKFVGNPYVYGGTSLTNGTDCSGFVMSVYAQYGYSLPRTAAAQAGAGRSVSLSELQPGDLLFYSNGSYIGHVAMYIGGGSVVHASNPTDGIKISAYNYRTPSCARRIVG